MSGHTPGPWLAITGSLSFANGVYGPKRPNQDRNWIADTEVGVANFFERQANARLIAAAPELLAACQAMRFHADTCQKLLITDREIPFPCNCGYDLAQDAIAKAEPESNSSMRRRP